MKKKIVSFTIAILSVLPSFAQLNGDGYYRIKNKTTGRYMTLCDNHSKGVNASSTTAEVGALETRKSYEDIVSDPGSVFYIKKVSNDDYNIFAQGADMYALTKYYIKLRQSGTRGYIAYQTSSGYSLRLQDEIINCGKDGDSYVTTVSQNDLEHTDYWDIIPVTNTGDSYIGIAPKVNANGKHYALYYTGFAYNLLSSGMKAYYVTKVDESRDAVVYKEITGTIPAKTPVVIECSSESPANNKIEPLSETVNAIGGNQLKGVFFSAGNIWSGHYNSIVYNETSMRTMNSKDGKLTFNTSTDMLPTVEVCLVPGSSHDKDYEMKKCIDHNTAYIQVSSSAKKDLNWVSEADYSTGITNINTDESPSSIYDLQGNIVKKDATSTEGISKGIYIYKGKKLVIR